MLTLYFSPGSSSTATHIALHEVGVPFERRLIALAKKENRTPEYLALNPEGKVPTLLVDGRPLTEVAGILYYLARRYPEARLWPDGDIEAEAHVISWMSFIAATMQPSRRQGIGRAREVFGIADRRLGNKVWVVESYSIADIHLFRLYWRFLSWFHRAPEEFPSLGAHYHRMMARSAVQRTLEVEATIGYELSG